MKHLDLSFIHKNVTDDPAFIGQLLDVFIAGIDEDVPKLRPAIEQGDHATIRATAHKIKSGFRSLGMVNITNQLQGLEDLAKDKADMSDILEAFARFNALLPEVRQEIQAFKSE